MHCESAVLYEKDERGVSEGAPGGFGRTEDSICDADGNLPQTLIYLSCGFSALMRDCDALLASGQWRLVHAHAFLFFPGTDSLETLAVFQTTLRI